MFIFSSFSNSLELDGVKINDPYKVVMGERNGGF